MLPGLTGPVDRPGDPSPTRRRARSLARRVAGTACALVLVTSVGACASDDGSDGSSSSTTATEAGTTDDTTSGTDAVGEDAQAYVDALVATFEAGDPDDQLYTEEQVTCLAEGFVDVIGLDALQDAGLSPEAFADGGAEDLPAELGLDDDKANALYDTFAGCDIDLPALFASTGGTELTAEQQACLDEILTEENLRASFVASFTGDESGADPLAGASACLGVEDGG